MGNQSSKNEGSEFEDRDNILQKAIVQDIQGNEWDDYQRMLNTLQWKDMPQKFETTYFEDNHAELYKLLLCIKAKRGKPAQIRSFAHLKDALKGDYSKYQQLIASNMDIDEDSTEDDPVPLLNSNGNDEITIDKRSSGCGCVIL